MKKTVVLAILDGWGIGRHEETNPLHAAHPVQMEYIEEHFPAGMLQASGIAVGLPWSEEGNSEVGHMTLGAGTVLYQHYPKISLMIRNGSFFENKTLKEAFRIAREQGVSVHLVGLIGEGIVHSAFEHVEALLKMAKKESCEKVFVHGFSDGRDSGPFSGKTAFQRLQEVLQKEGVGEIATISGRYFGMDRDKHWDRTRKALDAILGQAEHQSDAVESVFEEAKSEGVSDEYIEPAIIGGGHPPRDGDVVIFFNFREDRMRQITEPFLNPDFSSFPVNMPSHLHVVSFAQYDPRFPGNTVFRQEKITNPLGKVLADAGKNQLRIAETEKYAHVTYFFNGFHEPPFPNEFRVLIPSKNVAHYEKFPEMMASSITDRVLSALGENIYDFILINYANTDIVAHTGNYEATVKAAQVVDREMGKLLKGILAGDHALIITADHGNAEVVLDLQTGGRDTKHNSSPVPFFLVRKDLELETPRNRFSKLPSVGFLSDVAPTILDLMDIPQPKEMTGQSLLRQLI